MCLTTGQRKMSHNFETLEISHDLIGKFSRKGVENPNSLGKLNFFNKQKIIFFRVSRRKRPIP